MKSMQQITRAKRKRLLKTFGSPPAGYTHVNLERLLDLLYGMLSDVYTRAELRAGAGCQPKMRQNVAVRLFA